MDILRFALALYCSSCATAAPLQHVRIAAGVGVGDSGPAAGAQIALERRVGERQAVGVAAGIDGNSNISFGAQSGTTVAYGAAVWRVGFPRTGRAWESQPGWHYSFAILAGAGNAKHSFQEGDCGLNVFDDGIDDPFDACVGHSRSAWGGLVGTEGNALYSFGQFGIGVDASARVLLGPVGAVNVTLGPVLSLGF